ncbi:MAG TPA: helix-turn-helix domain-containing protein [Anaerolineae bacterium]|nr:helix-turn-helix domain-containing protein [Anaerolineae bacterium]
MQDNQLLTTEEVAELLRVPRQWVFRQTNSPNGLLKGVVRKIGRYNRYPKAEIDKIFNLGGGPS